MPVEIKFFFLVAYLTLNDVKRTFKFTRSLWK